jgi:hypothetical protein
LGAKGIPDNLTPIVPMMTQAFSDMTPERLQALIASGLLKENETIAMMEMLRVLTQADEEQKAKK